MEMLIERLWPKQYGTSEIMSPPEMRDSVRRSLIKGRALWPLLARPNTVVRLRLGLPLRCITGARCSDVGMSRPLVMEALTK